MKKILLTILIVSTLAIGYVVFADTEGANSPGTMADDNAVGTQTWSDVNNAKVSDNAYATVSAAAPPAKTSHYLKATNFGFSVPAGTIDGITVEIERKRVGADAVIKDSAVKIVKADGTIGTTNNGDTVNAWPTSDTYKTYGGSADVWGETWTPTDINDADFGVVLSAVGMDGDNSASVDHIRITVTYTPASGTPQLQIRTGTLNIKTGNLIIR